MTHYHHLGIIEFHSKLSSMIIRRTLGSGNSRFILRNEKTTKPSRIGITLEHLFFYMNDGIMISGNTPVYARYECES